MPDPLQPESGTEPVPVAIASFPPEVVLPAIVAAATIVKGGKGEPLQNQSSDPSLAATTTFEQNLISAGQRNINVMWEGTQRIIAIAVTLITLLVCSWLAIYGKPETAVPAFMLLSNVFFLVVGTYFQRTNHTKTGGVGSNPSVTR